MHRIDTDGSVEGLWNPGNPAIGQRATKFSSDWLNDVQENLVYLMEQAGVPPAKGEYGQLYEAVLAMIVGGGGGGGGGGGDGVPATRQILTSGLASGGGDLVADRTIHVPKATTSEAAAGVRDDVAVTPAGLAAASGLILQTGTTAVYRNGPIIHQVFQASISRHTETVLTLPYAFPNAALVGFINVPGAWPGIGIFDGESNVKTIGKTSISVWADHQFWGPGPTTTAHLLVIGR